MKNLTGGQGGSVDLPDGLLRSTELSKYGRLDNRVHQHRVGSSELMTTEVISSESLTTEPALPAEAVRSAAAQPRHHSNVRLGSGLGAVPPVPTTVERRSDWFKQIACDEALAITQLTALGGHVDGLEEPFASLLTGEVGVAELVRGQSSAEIVYHDRSLAGTRCEFMPLPDVLACQVNSRPLRLPARQLIEWRPRLLHKAGLILLPEVRLRPLTEGVTDSTRIAYEGARLLLGCRWLLEPGESVPYSAAFIQTWCGISKAQAVAAREYLRRHVLRLVGTVPCGRPKEMQMFLPLEVGQP
jgi:hypothetical protein